MPFTGRPAAVQEPSPTCAGEVKGLKVAGAGRGTGAFGACDVEVLVAGVVVVVVVVGRGEYAPGRPDAFA